MPSWGDQWVWASHKMWMMMLHTLHKLPAVQQPSIRLCFHFKYFSTRNIFGLSGRESQINLATMRWKPSCGTQNFQLSLGSKVKLLPLSNYHYYMDSQLQWCFTWRPPRWLWNTSPIFHFLCLKRWNVDEHGCYGRTELEVNNDKWIPNEAHRLFPC